MPTIQIHSQVAGPCLMAEAGTTLYALLSENGIHLDAPCGGKCYCGKCKVKVEPPLYEEMSAEEGALLSPQDMQASIRLACGYTIRTGRGGNTSLLVLRRADRIRGPDAGPGFYYTSLRGHGCCR